MSLGSKNQDLRRRDHPYGGKIADFPFLKIRPRVYFQFMNTVIMKIEFYRLFPFSACPNRENLFPGASPCKDHSWIDTASGDGEFTDR